MPPEAVLLRGKGENRYIFARKEDYAKGRRRKDEKDYWAQYQKVVSLDLSEPFLNILTTNKTGYTIESLKELVRDVRFSIQELTGPVNREIDKMYEGIKHTPKPQHL